jgi:hypothetical protein
MPWYCFNMIDPTIKLAPIVLFVYNRPWHTLQTVEALQKNNLADQSDLIIYSDASKNDQSRFQVQEVRDYLKTIIGFKSVRIIERDNNWGLASSVIDGVSKIVNQYGKVIVLEDDLVTSPYFLTFMNDSLNIYEFDEQVASIHGYIYPITCLPPQFFIKGADCWGWATWSRAWDKFEPDGGKLLNELRSNKLEKECDFNNSYGFTQMLKDQINGKNDSWAIRWYVSTFLLDMLTLYPGKSYVRNIGNDDSGTHCGTSEAFDIDLNTKYSYQNIDVKEDLLSKVKIEKYFSSLKISFLKRIVTKLKRINL